MIRKTGKPKTVWTSLGGLRMHARLSEGLAPEGSPAIVLVHGLIVSSRYMIPTLERLAPHYRVYAPDLPGFGKSDKPPYVLNVAGLSDSLSSWMHKISLQRATLVGNSFGCQIIADLAVRHPECVARAVLQGPTMDPRARTALQQIGRGLLRSTREPPSLTPIIVRDYLNAGFVRVLHTFRYALEDRIEEKLPRMRVPTLVVRGSRDPIVPQRWAEEATHLLPQGRLVVIPGAAHTVNYQAPSEFVCVIRAFLDEDGRPAAEPGA